MIRRFAIYEQSKCVRCGNNRHNWFTSFSWWMVAATNRTAIHFHCNSILLHSLNCPIMRIFSCSIFLCPTDRPANQPSDRSTDIISILLCNCPKRHTSRHCLQTQISCAIMEQRKKARDKATEECHGKNLCLGLRKKFIMCVPIMSNVCADEIKVFDKACHSNENYVDKQFGMLYQVKRQHNIRIWISFICVRYTAYIACIVMYVICLFAYSLSRLRSIRVWSHFMGLVRCGIITNL